MKNYFITLFFAIKSIFIGCPFDKSTCMECREFDYEIVKIGRLPREVKESSGLVLFDDLFLTQPDSDNPPTIWGVKYPFEKDKEVNGTISLPDSITNNDWEALAKDNKQNLYIGDFGNFKQDRKDLKVIKYDLVNNSFDSINYSYEDQKGFPPKKGKLKNYDCEAMLWARDNLYLFSKNKGNNYVKVYRLPDQPGEYKAQIVDTLHLSLQITGADISPDEQFVTLLSYGKVLLYRADFDEEDILRLTPFHCKQFSKSGQSEAIAFVNKDNLVITNEKGSVFWMSLAKGKTLDRNPEMEEVFPQLDSVQLKEFQ